MKYNFVILSICVLSVFISAHEALSQTTAPAQQPFNPLDLIDPNSGLPLGVEEQISIEQTPEIPKPNELVSIRLTSYMTNLNKAKITWSQDGKIILSQTGAVTNQVQAPESGKSSVLTISVVKENGGVFTKTITLSPADVDLIYEAQTYAHPFFKGKKLFTSEAVVSLIAVPNFVVGGKQVPAENLIYTWSTNGTVQQSISGYGKNTFIMQGTLIERPMQIEVEVSAINSTLVASESLVLKSKQPELLIYENNPILGVIYEQAVLGSFVLERNQVDFEAVPYFFSTEIKDGFDLAYKWMINGTHVATKSPRENYLLLQNNNNEEGRALISVTLNQTQKLLQNTKSGFELNFKKIKETSNETDTF